jgi:hypothetical protein
VNCSTPPVKPGAGTWVWDGRYKFGTNISYTCGPYGNFQVSFQSSYKKVYSHFFIIKSTFQVLGLFAFFTFFLLELLYTMYNLIIYIFQFSKGLINQKMHEGKQLKEGVEGRGVDIPFQCPYRGYIQTRN